MPNRFQHQAGSTMTPKLHSALSSFFSLPSWQGRIGPYTDIADGLDGIRTAFREAIDEKQLSGGTPPTDSSIPPTNIGATMTAAQLEVLQSALNNFSTLTEAELVTTPSALGILREYLSAAISDVQHKESTPELEARYATLIEILSVVNLIDAITTARQ